MLSSSVGAAEGAIPAGRPAQAAPVPWPELREELRLHRAGDNPDGSPAWHVADPVANRYCRIGWLEFEMLVRWHLGDAAQIAAQIRADTVLQVEPTDVEAFAAFARSPGKRLTLVGEDTKRQCEQLLAHFKRAPRLPRIPESVGEFAASARRARVLYLASQYSHGALAEGRKVIPLLLRLSPLRARTG